MIGIIGTKSVSQIGIIVRDMEEAKARYAEFYGVDVPPHFDGGKFEVTGTTIEGEPAPDANCWMAFFDVGPGLQLELIQPNGHKSAWQDFLDEYGEGLHHIAYNVEDMEEAIRSCEAFGMKVLQRGKYGDGGGEYTYLDARDSLRCYIELLQSY